MNDIEVIAQFRCLMAKFKEQQKLFAFAALNVMEGDVKKIPVFEAAYINTRKVVVEIKEKMAQYDLLQIDDLT